MKKILLVLLCAYICEHAPWRIGVLSVDVALSHPGMARMADGNDAYWKVLDLAHKLRNFGWNVEFKPILSQGVYGLTIPDEHTILIEETLSWNGRYSVLTHEAGHSIQPSWYTEAQGEIFAESVSALLDGNLHEHARYLSRFKFEYFMVVLCDYRHIYEAAAILSP